MEWECWQAHKPAPKCVICDNEITDTRNMRTCSHDCYTADTAAPATGPRAKGLDDLKDHEIWTVTEDGITTVGEAKATREAINNAARRTVEIYGPGD